MEAANDSVLAVDMCVRVVAQRLLDDRVAQKFAACSDRRRQERNQIFEEFNAATRHMPQRGRDRLPGESPHGAARGAQGQFRGRRFRELALSP